VTRKFLVCAACSLSIAYLSVPKAVAEQQFGDIAVEVEQYHTPGAERVQYSHIFFVTNRSVDKTRLQTNGTLTTLPRDTNVDKLFLNSMNALLTIGKAEIEYPSDRVFAEQTYSNDLYDENPLVNFVATRIDFADGIGPWLRDIGLSYNPLTANGYLMFIHGFNVSFNSAIAQATQLKEDLSFKGPMLLFSWPSDLGMSKTNYLQAGKRELVTSAQLSPILRGLDSVRYAYGNLTDIKWNEQIIAHSMGARLTLDSLNVIHNFMPNKMVKLNTLILAAADVNRESFRSRDLPVIGDYAGKTFILCSQIDIALAVAKMIDMHESANEFNEGNDEQSERLGQCVDYDSTFKREIEAGEISWYKFTGPRKDIWAHSYFVNDANTLLEVKKQIVSPLIELRSNQGRK
jgi:hypothetical protein